MDFLKLLTGKLAEGVKVEDLVKEINTELPKSFIPKDKYNAKVEELNATTGKMGELQTKLTAAAEATGTAETLKADLAKVTGEFDTFKADTGKRELSGKKISALMRQLAGAKVAPDLVKAVAGAFDVEKLELNDKEDIKDFDTYLAPVKLSMASAFLTESTKTPPIDDGAGGETSDEEDEAIRKAMGLS